MNEQTTESEEGHNTLNKPGNRQTPEQGNSEYDNHSLFQWSSTLDLGPYLTGGFQCWFNKCCLNCFQLLIQPHAFNCIKAQNISKLFR